MSVKSQIRRRQFKNSIPSQLRFISIALIAVLLYYVYSLRKQLNKKEPETTTGEIETCADCPKCDSCCPDCPDCPNCPQRVDVPLILSFFYIFLVVTFLSLLFALYHKVHKLQKDNDAISAFKDDKRKITGFFYSCFIIGYLICFFLFAHNAIKAKQIAISVGFIFVNIFYILLYCLLSYKLIEKPNAANAENNG